MARPLRIDQAGTFYHVLNRGNERHTLFRDDKDYQGFISRLGRCCRRFELETHAYVLMGNHYHLVVRTSHPNLSAAMHWLQGSYAVWHNSRHQRNGHLFQGRFKAFMIKELDYLQRLLLYVHRNPLRAGLADRLREYPWSSYRALAYNRREPDWFDPALVYALLQMDAPSLRRAIAGYDEQEDRLWEDLHHGLVLGSQAVVDALREHLGQATDPEQPQRRQLQSSQNLEEGLRDYACRLGLYQQQWELLLRPTRRTTRPERDVLIYLLWSEGRFHLAEIAKVFLIGYAAVSLAKTRGENHLRTHPAQARKLGVKITS